MLQENIVVISKNRARITALEEEVWRLEAGDRGADARAASFDTHQLSTPLISRGLAADGPNRISMLTPIEAAVC